MPPVMTATTGPTVTFLTFYGSAIAEKTTTVHATPPEK